MKHRRFQELLLSLLTAALGMLVVFPLIYCFCGAFKTSREFLNTRLFPESFLNFANFAEALQKGNLLRYALNSFIVAFFGSAIRLAISIPAAYAFSFFEFKGKRFCFLLTLGTLMIPADVLFATNYLTISRLHLLNTWFGCMAVSFVSASQVLMLRQKFLAVPKSLRQAARVDGYGDAGFLVEILLPLCKSVLTILFIQSFITLWNAYLWPLIVTASAPEMRTITVGITRLNSWENENYQLVLAGVCLSLIPSLILYFLLRKSMKKDSTDGAVTG